MPQDNILEEIGLYRIMRIGILTAMESEYRQMAEVLGGGPQGRTAGHEVLLSQCGIGKVNAAVGTMRMVQQFHPDCIISTGLAGGIDNCLQVMDVVVGAQTAYHDVWCGMGTVHGQVMGLPPRFDADPQLLQCAMRVAEKIGGGVRCGLICTGDQFITNKEALREIKAHFADGLACDMESAAIAQTCHLLEVPFISLRVVSDTPGNTDNHQQQWEEFLAQMTSCSFHFVEEFLRQLP